MRTAARILAREPGYLLMAAATMALCIGASTGVYSIAEAVILRPLPYPNADRLVIVNDQLLRDASSVNPVSPAQYQAWAAEATTFEEVGAFTDAFFTVTSSDGRPERVPGVSITPEMIDLVGFRTTQGRAEVFVDDGGYASVLVSAKFWRSRFGSSRLQEQTTLVLNDQPHRVTGILSEDSYFNGKAIDVVAPLPDFRRRSVESNHRLRYLSVLARLKPSVRAEAAKDNLAAVCQRLGQEFPATDKGRTARVTPLDAALLGDAKTRLSIVGASVTILLLMACVNVSSLALARSVAKRKSTAVRLALGAGPWDLFRPVIAESAVVCVTGALGGLLVARVVLALVRHFAPQGVPRLETASIGGTAILFSLAVSVICALATAVLPAWQALSHNAVTALRDGNRGSSSSKQATSARSYLLVAEVALAVILLTSASLIVTSLRRLLLVDPGFKSGGAVVFDLSLPRAATPEVRGRWIENIVNAVGALPGVQAVGVTNRLPLSGDSSSRAVNMGSRPDPQHRQMVEVRRISPRYFEAMGMRLIAGRQLTEFDTESSRPAVVVNESFVKQMNGGSDPIGKILCIQEGEDPAGAEIVGVVNDVRNVSLASSPQPEVYESAYASPFLNASLVIRTSRTGGLSRAVGDRVLSAAPGTPIARVYPLEDLISEATKSQRFYAFLLTFFSVIATVLAGTGIYGVAAYNVTQRTVEIGTRIALGATAGNIVSLVVRWMCRTVLGGICIGSVGALVIGRLFRRMLFGVEPFDPFTYVMVILAVTTVAIAAGVGPALRAAHVDPSVAQRA